MTDIGLSFSIFFFHYDFEHSLDGAQGTSAHRNSHEDGKSKWLPSRQCRRELPCVPSPGWKQPAQAGTPCSWCCWLLQQVKQQEIMEGFMPQTRLGSPSVTSAIVTACSSVMLNTSCPPGMSFPTCFPQLCPSRFGRSCWRQLVGVYEASSALGCGS